MPATVFHPLKPYPGTHPDPGGSLCARLDGNGRGGLVITYRLYDSSDDIVVPLPAKPAFIDNLWQHTCFEAFVATSPAAPHYREFNFSPSGEWAAYDFAAYRQRDPGYRADVAPRIGLTRSDAQLELVAELPAALLPPPGEARRLHIGLAAVIEATQGGLSYLALHHPANRPDFHHRGGFVLELADPRSPQEHS